MFFAICLTPLNCDIGMGEVSDSVLVFAKLFIFWVDLSFNSECNGLFFIKIGAVEVEISFLFNTFWEYYLIPNLV